MRPEHVWWKTEWNYSYNERIEGERRSINHQKSVIFIVPGPLSEPI